MKTLRLITAVALLCLTSIVFAQQPRHLLQNAWKAIDASMVQPEKACNYPAYSDRAGWNALMSDGVGETYIKNAERYLDYVWQGINATDYLEFERSGSRSVMEKPFSSNRSALNTLIFGELAEGKGRFLPQIINGVWHFSHMPSWVYSAHGYRKDSGRALPDPRDVIMDLGSQSTGRIIALALHFFRDEMDKVDPAITVYADLAMEEKLFKPYMDPTKWKAQSWLGFTKPGEEKPYFWENWDPRNNWNIWCNVAVAQSYCLACKDRDEILRGLNQAVVSADNFLDFVKMDGACDEGPAYWRHASGCLFEFIRLMNNITGGRFGCWDDPQFIARSTYLSRCNLGDGWTVNFGDGTARSAGSPYFAYAMGRTAGIDEMTRYAFYLQACRPDPMDFYPGLDLDALLDKKAFERDFRTALAEAGGDIAVLRENMRRDIPAVTWYPQTEHLIVRSKEGISFAAKGGHNEESHNHNDVGSVIVFMDEMPVMVDVGPTTYMRQTFNKKERYTIWSMRSEWHNLPMMNGRPQHEGGEFKSSWAKADEKTGAFSAEIAGAYEEDAALRSLVRSCRLDGKTLTISDRYELARRIAADEEHFMVRGDVKQVRDGEILITYTSFDGKRSGQARMTYSRNLKATIETRTLDDPRHINIWGPDLKRIVLRSADKAPVKGTYTIKITKLS